MRWTTGAVVVGVATASLVVWSDLVQRRASGRRLGHAPVRAGDRQVVVVLGFRNRGARANVVNRWRVRTGLRSLAPSRGGSAVLVCSGGAVAGPHSEAALMAEHARTVLGHRGPLRTETRSRSTWENVREVIPLLEDADRIAFASNPLHAEKARAYLWRQRPDLAARLVRADDHRSGALGPLGPLVALAGVRGLRSLR